MLKLKGIILDGHKVIIKNQYVDLIVCLHIGFELN